MAAFRRDQTPSDQKSISILPSNILRPSQHQHVGTSNLAIASTPSLTKQNKLPLINAVPGAGGRSMIFYVDPKTKEINQFSAPTGPESLDRKRRNYDGPVLVTDQGDKEYVTSSSDLAVVSYREVRDGQEVLTVC
jgi:hypothetical protein